MKIEDEGIILSQRQMQENMLLLKILSRNHGVCSGIAKNVKSSKRYDYQACSLVKFERFVRLENQLGVLCCHKIRSFQGEIISSKINLYKFKNLANLILSSFREYESHVDIFCFMEDFLSSLDKVSWLKYCNYEFGILKNAGYALDLSRCAVSGTSEDLAFVSPKSGKAVSKKCAEGYEHLLLTLPNFLHKKIEPLSQSEVLAALDLTEYFFKRYIWLKQDSGINGADRTILRSIAAQIAS